MTKIRDGPL